MKFLTLNSLLAALSALTVFASQPVLANENTPSVQIPAQVEAKSLKGFNLGLEVSGLTDKNISGAVAKMDLIGGYRFNDYFSLNLDLWTIYLLAYGIEINPRVHFPTNSSVSPYIGISAGYMTFGFLETLVEEFTGDDLHFFTVSAGPGIDIALSDQTTLNVGLKYRGFISHVSSSVGIEHGMEGNVGVRWRF